MWLSHYSLYPHLAIQFQNFSSKIYLLHTAYKFAIAEVAMGITYPMAYWVHVNKLVSIGCPKPIRALSVSNVQGQEHIKLDTGD